MPDENATDLQEIGEPVKNLFIDFAKETGRKLKLEIEPGTFLLAHACSLVTHVQDITSTGKDGYRFLKLNAGMTEILRPSLYGAQHPIFIIPEAGQEKFRDYCPQVVVGHCCESGDLLTPASGDPEALAPRNLLRGEVGDFCVIEVINLFSSNNAEFILSTFLKTDLEPILIAGFVRSDDSCEGSRSQTRGIYR